MSSLLASTGGNGRPRRTGNKKKKPSHPGTDAQAIHELLHPDAVDATVSSPAGAAPAEASATAAAPPAPAAAGDLSDDDMADFDSAMADHAVPVVPERRGPVDLRLAVIGNVDSGKSTLIGVLTSGDLDDGRGKARTKVFRHDHEAAQGRTSCAGHHIMGFDAEGAAVHQPVPASAAPRQKTKAWAAVVEKSDRVITFVDLAGHEKYLKTTIAGLTGCFPDYALIIIGANMGVSKMTREHLAVAIALEIPILVVVTKVDMCPENVLKHTIKQLYKILKSPVCGKMPMLMKRDSDLDTVLAQDGQLQRICPVFLASAVSGLNVNKLYTFLSRLEPRSSRISGAPGALSIAAAAAASKESKASTSSGKAASGVVFEIDETFSVHGVGIVVSGTLTAGKMKKDDSLLLGPFGDGLFRAVIVRSIHSKRVPVDDCVAGDSCSCSLRFVRRKEIMDRRMIRRGMVLASADARPAAVWEFEAQILVLHHPTTIKKRYQPVIHCGSIRQTATIRHMSCSRLRTGDRARIRFRFLSHPEFIVPGRTLIVREGNTKCIGRVDTVFPDAKPPSGPGGGGGQHSPRSGSTSGDNSAAADSESQKGSATAAAGPLAQAVGA